MITKFDSLYAGHVDLENIGYGGTPINDRRFDNAHLSTALTKAQAMAKHDGRARLLHLLDGRTSLSARGDRVHPQRAADGAASDPCDAEYEDRLRLQHHADVASAAPRRGLRDGRHPVARPRGVRRRPRLPYPRGRNVRRAADRSGSQPRTVRGTGRDHLQGVQQRIILRTKASTTRCRPKCPIAAIP